MSNKEPELPNINAKEFEEKSELNKEVEPETTLKDINWVQPKPKVKKQPIIETNISGSGLGEYKTKYYPESGKFHCSCPGFWRSGGNCKHVKALKLKLGL